MTWEEIRTTNKGEGEDKGVRVKTRERNREREEERKGLLFSNRKYKHLECGNFF